MLEKLHDHIVEELGHSSRTDTIFIVVAVVFNLIVLGVNSAAASGAAANRNSSGGSYNLAADIVLAVFIVMTILINLITIAGLYVGRRTRSTLLDGLISMYTDKKVNKYYDNALVSNYGTRYILFGAVIVLLGLTAIIIPLVMRLM